MFFSKEKLTLELKKEAGNKFSTGWFLCDSVYYRRKRSEKNEVIPVETQGLQIQIVNKLRLEYMQHLVEQIKKQQKDYLW